MKTTLTIEHLTKDRQLIKRLQQPSRSWVIAFIQQLYLMSAQDGAYSLTDISNTARTCRGTSFNNNGNGLSLRVAVPGGGSNIVICGSDNSGYMQYAQTNNFTLQAEEVGIVVGSDDTAVVPSDYKLNTVIAHGKAASQLEYGGCSVGNYIESAPNVTFDITRYFINNSGGDVTAKECGIYAPAGSWGASQFIYSFCIARDILGAPITIANTEILQVIYTVSTTV